MRTATELDVPVDDTEAPSGDQPADESGADSPEPGQTTPRPEPTAREKELEERLRRQGSELAQTRRAAIQATSEVATLREQVDGIVAKQSEGERENAERRERERENYLSSLPPDKRTQEELKLLRTEIQALKSRPAAQPAQPATRTNAEDPSVAYMRQRAQEILSETQDEFGVEISQDDISKLPQTVWDSEENFVRALARVAAHKAAGGTSVATKKVEPETEAQMRERVTREVRDEMGVGSPAAPRAAGKPGKKPTETDVRDAVQSYSSVAGPKANIARLKEMRAKMNG